MAGVSDPGYRLIGPESHLQQTRTARVLRRIRWNGRAALAAESARAGHFIARLFLSSNTARKFPLSYVSKDTNLKLARFPARSPLPVAALPSISLIPSVPFTNSHELAQALMKLVIIRAIRV